MPPRDPALPEGTDQIIPGASVTESSGSSPGFVATGGGQDLGAGTTTGSSSTGLGGTSGTIGSGSSGGSSAGSTSEKLVSQVKDQVASLKGQATDKLRGAADERKAKATDLLDEVAGIIDEAARAIDSRLGSDYADYARRASGAVTGFAGRIRDKDVDDLLDDTRDMVRRSPGIAVAAAAAIGFAVMRVIRTGLDQNETDTRRRSLEDSRRSYEDTGALGGGV